jgi:DNA-binding LacI/PurR family transcriptional regulator
MQKLNVQDVRPLYRQLEALLEGKIRNSDYAPGDLIPSDRQLCRDYSVSYLTARQAVGELVKRGLLVRKQGKGTFVARPGDHGATVRNIGLLCTSGVTSFQEYYGTIIDGIETFCREVHYSIQIFMTGGASLVEPQNQLLSELVHTGKISGLILLEPILEQDLKQLLEGVNVPVVSIIDYKRIDCPRVVADHKKSGYALTKHLISLGHRRIALMIKPLDSGASEIVRAANQVFEGYREALATSGIPFDQALVKESKNTLEGATAPSAELFNMRPRPTAIVGGAQRLVEAAAKEAVRRGLAIPRDVSIVGVVEEDFDRFYTGMIAPTRLTGTLSAKMLIRLINGEDVSKDARKPMVCALRKGESTASPPDS